MTRPTCGRCCASALCVRLTLPATPHHSRVRGAGNFRDCLRSIARLEASSTLGPRVEGLFKHLERLDQALIDAKSADGTAVGKARQTAKQELAAALTELQAVLASLDNAVLESARALLQ